MTDSLPPSKFGAGYTYGGDAGNSQPAPPPPTSAYPQSAPPSYSQPPTHPQPPAYASTPPPPPRAPVSSYGAAGAPQYGAAAAAYPGSASGVTAIIAAVLALLLGAFRAYASIDLVKGLVYLAKLSGSVGMYMDKSVYVWTIAYAVVSLLGTALLLIGAIVLLSRGRAGRTMIVLGTLLILAEAVFSWVAATIFLQAAGMLGGVWNLGAVTALAVVVSVAVPLLTLILAWLPSTRNWCR
ncbi:hypothetical protein [Mycobacterium sp. 141]|uniref:hypothetical protein n=1 Tax=Mycobacterium sp. 141 TaxID=1120797 RepID=UPI000370345C|nr:hypothetical protein [Mycobacterium sp. 141]